MHYYVYFEYIRIVTFILLKGWLHNDEERPGFTELVNNLEQMCPQASYYIHLNHSVSYIYTVPTCMMFIILCHKIFFNLINNFHSDLMIVDSTLFNVHVPESTACSTFNVGTGQVENGHMCLRVKYWSSFVITTAWQSETKHLWTHSIALLLSEFFKCSATCTSYKS